jgi:hypothetical protein
LFDRKIMLQKILSFLIHFAFQSKLGLKSVIKIYLTGCGCGWDGVRKVPKRCDVLFEWPLKSFSLAHALRADATIISTF